MASARGRMSKWVQAETARRDPITSRGQKPMTIQQALPVVLAYLESVDVGEILSDDRLTGRAMEDLLARSLARLNDHVRGV